VAQIIPLLGGVRGGFLDREISVNISRITDLPTPKSPPKRGLSSLKQSLGTSQRLCWRFKTVGLSSLCLCGLFPPRFKKEHL